MASEARALFLTYLIILAFRSCSTKRETQPNRWFPAAGFVQGEKKTDKEKSHKGIWRSDARRRPRDKLGTSQGHLGHLELIYV